jgi:hypothetical protein
MGMTTERTIEIFNDLDRISGLLLRGNNEDDSLFNSETIEAMNNINVILHKYQQIQEIVNHWNNTGGSAEESDILDYIGEVLKDGKKQKSKRNRKENNCLYYAYINGIKCSYNGNISISKLKRVIKTLFLYTTMSIW